MSKKIHVTTSINGEETEYLCEPYDTMLDVLRNQLNLTGSKEVCSSGDCGACSVTLNDRLVCSCLMLAAEAEGQEIRTIEGMTENGNFHVLQQKFLETCSSTMWYLHSRYVSGSKSIVRQKSFAN